jgi:hypothetical protein
VNSLHQLPSDLLKSDHEELRTVEPRMAFPNFRYPTHYSQAIFDHFLRAMDNRSYDMLKGVEHEKHNVSRIMSWWVYIA